MAQITGSTETGTSSKNQAVSLSFFERAISVFSPKAAYRRATFRFKATVLNEQTRKYDAAARGRRTDDWNSTMASANTELWGALFTLRNRSRDLYRNNPYAFRAVNVVTSNTIGTGIKPTFSSKGVRQLKAIKEAWEEWAENTNIDLTGQQNFYAMQTLIMRTVAMSGECLVRIWKSKSKDKDILPVRLQILECDYIDHSHDRTVDSEGNYTFNGIQFNQKGQRLGYWLWEQHPGETITIKAIKSNFIKADEIIHIYKIERPGQERGAPFGVSGMIRLKDIEDYEDAQLIRQKIAACFALFVEDANEPLGSPNSQITTKPLPEKVEPGIIEYVAPGKKITFASPPGTEGYSEYIRKMLHGIAAAYGVSYEAMTSDLSNVNFSSGRMGWIEMSRLISEWQTQMIIPMFCDRVFEEFVKACLIVGKFTNKDVKVRWTPPRREMIDPIKEVNGLKEQVRAGLISYSEAVRQLGYNPDDVIAELAEDFKMFAENGLMLTSDPRYDATRKIGIENEETGTEPIAPDGNSSTAGTPKKATGTNK